MNRYRECRENQFIIDFFFFLFQSNISSSNSSTFRQSQPCHWRNIKSVAKRDVSNATSVAGLNNTKDKSVSDNISLFQSLRVLQEGEDEEPYSTSARSKYRFSLRRGHWQLLTL